MFLKFNIVVALSLFVLIMFPKKQPDGSNINKQLMGGASDARQEILV